MNNYNYFDVFNETFLGTTAQNTNNNNNNMSTSILYGPYEGFIKGNLFRNLYQQYKNYQPAPLTPRSEQEEALLNLNQIQFAMHELNLYLDNFPNDTNMMNQFAMFRNTYNRLLSDYENKYGAITINSPTLNTVPFGWVEKAWPWDRRSM